MKPHSVVIVGLILLASIFLGFFLVGNHFLAKNQRYAEERFERRERTDAEKRLEKVAAAKEANADDARIRKLRERLGKEIYEKRASYRDLEKIVGKSKKDLKIWYSADTDEDAEQAEAYLSVYETRERGLRTMLGETDRKREECESKIAALRRREEKQAARATELGDKSEELARKIEQTVAERAKTEKILAATPAFRKKPVEKKLRAQDLQLKKLEASVRRLYAEAEELKRENDRTELALRGEQERLDEILTRAGELLHETALCREAQRLTRAVIGNIREIQKIKAEILECETRRDDKKIDAGL